MILNFIFVMMIESAPGEAERRNAEAVAEAEQQPQPMVVMAEECLALRTL